MHKPYPTQEKDTTDTSNDHLSLSELVRKVRDHMLSVDALSAMEVPFQGKLLRFVKMEDAVFLKGNYAK